MYILVRGNINIRILLMCDLRAHINFHFWKKIFSRIEKVMIAFSIPKKIFLKIESLMCALRAHINRSLNIMSKSLFYTDVIIW